MAQLVAPNLATVGNIGWCLSFVENVFSTPHLGDTATDAWHSTQFPHLDRNFPGLYVPVWFSYFERGVDYGHVAVLAPDGRVLSSPYQKENTHVWFPNIAQCEAVLNCKYLGWSEDLATVRIVEGENMEDRNQYAEDWARLRYILSGADPNSITQADRELRLALPWAQANADLDKGLPLMQIPFEMQKTIDSLTAANLKLTDQLKAKPADPNSVVVTQTGLWVAFKRFLGL